MTLSEELKEWRMKLVELLEESSELQEKVAELEAQNRILRERLSRAESKEGGMEALRKLYDEGFHICHARFAQQRDEECLFCLSLLHNRGVSNPRA